MKALALLCKFLAAFIWSLAALFTIARVNVDAHATEPPRDAPADWGTPAYFHRMWLGIAVIVLVAALALIPNRWLVFSRTAFVISLIITLVPLGVVLVLDSMHDPFMSARNYLAPGAWAFVGVVFGPLPASLTLSFWRQHKGEKVTYV